MTSSNAKSPVHKTLYYILAYLLIALFAILGLVVIINLHSAVFQVSLIATTGYGVSNFFYVWGGFFLFAIYAVGIVLIESLMNKAAKTGSLLPVGVRILAIEAGLGLMAIVMPIVANWIWLPE
jgi:hypothetical protein